MMESVYDWGLNVISWVQQFQSPFLTLLMKGISLGGDPVFYFGLVPFLYWCIDSKNGFSLGLSIIFAGALNGAIKEVLQVPRPFIRDPSVFFVKESGFSTPSGHAQGSASFYPVFAARMMGTKKYKKCHLGGKCGSKKIPLCLIFKLIVAVVMPLLIGFSRIYLGVHYPSDVLIGLTLGFLTAAGMMLFWNPVAKIIGGWRCSLQILLVAVIVFVLNHFSGSHTSLSGALGGFCLGRIFWHRRGNLWDASGGWLHRIVRLPLGLVVTGLVFALIGGVKFILIQLLPTMDLEVLLKFIQFACTGFTMIYICPLLFMRLGLAMGENNGSEEDGTTGVQA